MPKRSNLLQFPNLSAPAKNLGAYDVMLPEAMLRLLGGYEHIFIICPWYFGMFHDRSWAVKLASTLTTEVTETIVGPPDIIP
jgi:hypothetical protein